MAGTITLYPINILEDGAVTVTGTPDAGYPEERLWDRTLALFWKDTVIEAKTFQVDQGADISDVDLLYIAGHNFDGRAMTWERSDNGSDWTPAVTGWNQSGNDPIVKTLSSAINHRYWRVTVASTTNPMAAEIMISLGSVFIVMGEPRPSEHARSNVSRNESIGGMVRKVMHGDTRKAWDYDIRLRGATDISAFREVLVDLDGIYRPLLVKDINDDYRLMEILSDPAIAHVPPLTGYTTLSLLEAL